MQTSPIRQGLWLVLAFAVVAIPLYMLTCRDAEGMGNSEKHPANQQQLHQETVNCFMEIRCADLPEKLIVTNNGTTVFDLSKNSNPSLRMECDVKLPLQQAKSVSLHVEARWDESLKDTPVTITIEPDGLRESSMTRWSQGSTLNDIFKFSW